MDNLEYIDTYFKGELSPEIKKDFEQRIVTDPVFAEEVAFYLSSKQVAATEMRNEKEKFKEIYQQYIAILQPGDTQWNSYYNCFKSFLKTK